MENSDWIMSISILALFFTIFSFWWMNWRKGKLNIYPPRTYAGIGSKDKTLVLIFPFVFFNNGPLPFVVRNLRIVFTDENLHIPMVFFSTIPELGKYGNQSLATPFPVKGREAFSLICKFHRTPGNLVFEKRKYNLELQAILDNSNVWKSMLHFQLNVSTADAELLNKNYTILDNLEGEIYK